MQKDWPFEKYQFKIALLNKCFETSNIYTLEAQLEFINILERIATQGVENVMDNLNIEIRLLMERYTKLYGGRSTTL